jgi:uncharacterized membrane protein
MKHANILWLLVFMLFALQTSFGHPGHKKKKAQSDSVQHPTSQVHRDNLSPAQATTDRLNEEAVMPPPLADYPTFHPMVVHAPIVLLILAALLQIIALVKPAGTLNGLILVVGAVGAVGAYVAGTLVHPHTDGLSDSAQAALESHETYADYTLWLAIVGTLLKGITLWRSWRWLEGLTAVALLGAGMAVGLAAHQGGALTFLYGIGPRGAYLEQHDGEHSDGNRHEHHHPDSE